MEVIVKSCLDCPACDMNDMCSGYSCRFLEHPENYIKESENFQPIRPDWCPLREGSVLIKFDK